MTTREIGQKGEDAAARYLIEAELEELPAGGDPASELAQRPV